MTAFGTSNQPTLPCRLRTALAACYPGVGFAEPEPAFGTLDNVSELHLHRTFLLSLFIKITECLLLHTGYSSLQLPPPHLLFLQNSVDNSEIV